MNQHLPAFPLARPMDQTLPNIGLTKREYFAAMAMQGLLGGISYLQDPSVLAHHAVAHADDLLKELETKKDL